MMLFSFESFLRRSSNNISCVHPISEEFICVLLRPTAFDIFHSHAITNKFGRLRISDLVMRQHVVRTEWICLFASRLELVYLRFAAVNVCIRQGIVVLLQLDVKSARLGTRYVLVIVEKLAGNFPFDLNFWSCSLYVVGHHICSRRSLRPQSNRGLDPHEIVLFT